MDFFLFAYFAQNTRFGRHFDAESAMRQKPIINVNEREVLQTKKKNHPKGKDAFVSSRIYRVSFIRFWSEKLLHVLSQFGARNTKSRVPFVNLCVRIIQKARIIYGFWAAKKEEFWNGELVWKLSPTEPSTAELKGVFRGRRDYVQAGILYIILQKKSKK